MGLPRYLWAILSQESTYMGGIKSKTCCSLCQSKQLSRAAGNQTWPNDHKLQCLNSLCQSSRKPEQKVRTLLWKKGKSFWPSYRHFSTTIVGTPSQNLPTSIFLSYCGRHLANILIYRTMCQILVLFPA